MATTDSGSGSENRWIGWLVLGIAVLVLILASRPATGLREGHQGSYLGHAAKDSRVAESVLKDIGNRQAAQRY